jgi:hypothetical protein
MRVPRFQGPGDNRRTIVKRVGGTLFSGRTRTDVGQLTSPESHHGDLVPVIQLHTSESGHRIG